MKKLFATATILATFTTGLAHADIFDFSYTFTNGGDVMTGSFTGILNQSTNLISNISNINIAVDGVAFSGPLIAVGWSPTTNFDDSLAAVVSPNASLNNFAFADVDLAVNQQWNNGLVFVNDPSAGASGQTISAFDASIQDSSGYVSDTPANASWKVEDLSAVQVPIPVAAQMLFAASLGLLSTILSRRLSPTF